MKKKLLIIVPLVLVVAVTAVLAVLLANRGKEADEEEEFLPTAGQVDVSQLKDAKLKLYFEAKAIPAMTEVLEAVNAKLRAELKTELTFEMIYDYPDNYYAKIKSDTAAGKQCDAFAYSSYFGTSLETLAKEGLAKDLTKDFPLYAPDYYGQFTNDELDAISIDGRIYSIPYRIPSAQRICAVVRTDLMSRYGIQDIKSFEDYERYLEAVKTNDPGLIPMNYWDTTIGLFSGINGYVILDYELGLVYKWDDPSMKLMAWEQTPGFADGLNKIKGWYDREYLLKNVGIANIDESMIASGKWASFITNWGNEFNYNAILAGNEIRDYQYKAYLLHDGYSPRNSPLESMLVVNEKSDQADRVLMFVNWLQSRQENYDLFMYGVKDKHYTDKGDYIVPAEGVSMSESFFQWGWKGPFRNVDYERVNYSGLEEGVERYRDVLETKTRFPPHTGFTPDYSAVSDITTIRRMGFSELDRKIYTGVFKEEDIEVFIKEQKDAGVQNLIDVIQKQIDEFRK